MDKIFLVHKDLWSIKLFSYINMVDEGTDKALKTKPVKQNSCSKYPVKMRFFLFFFPSLAQYLAWVEIYEIPVSLVVLGFSFVEW